MNQQTFIHRFILFALMTIFAVSLTACNLSASPEDVALTEDITGTVQPTRTPFGTASVPTTLPLTRIAGVTPQRPSSVVIVPTAIPPFIPQQPGQPQQTVPASIVILSPSNSNIVAGNVQVIGSAIHPQFLQYQLEYGPDPNPGNLWFPITGGIRNTVLNNVLGIWNTMAVQDGAYQLRLSVFLRDTTRLNTVVRNLRIQNRAPTPQPTTTPNIARPIAAFSQDVSSGPAPLRLRFRDQSRGSIDEWRWDFGDGQQSSDRNPRHTFERPGRYVVTLTVRGPGGNSNVSTTIRVQSPEAPSAGFTMSAESGVAPLTVQFTDRSVGRIDRYEWNFSDGAGSTERSPSHTFTTPGTYNVFLSVEGPGGSSSTRREVTVLGPTVTPPPTLTATIDVPPPPTDEVTEEPAPLPVPSFDGQVVGDLQIQFTDLSTSSAAGGITAWYWEFGDGGTSTEQNPVQTFPEAGEYTVSLTITDANGSANLSASVNVPVPLPFTANFNWQVTGEQQITFTDLSVSEGSSITAWQWDFGDGSGSSEQNPAHTYAASGVYTVSLTATDASGRSVSASQSVSVPETVVEEPTATATTTEPEPPPAQPPAANFGSQSAGDLQIQFSDFSSSPSSAALVGWQWDFGDGNGSSEQNPSHTYAAAGDYTVTLTVTDANGQSSSTTLSVNVPEPPPPAQPPAANFGSQSTGDLQIQFTDLSSSPAGAALVGWQWDFGDGNGSSEQNPSHTYAAAGDYTVTLTVTDANEQSGSITQSVNVPEPPPPAQPPAASFSPQSIADLQIQFTDLSSSPAGAALVGWQWDFGDGNGSSEQNPSHTYGAAGDYTVTLTVTDANGQSGSITQSVNVPEPAPLPLPEANFGAQPGGEAFQIQFSDTSVSPTGSINTWFWDFGDGSTSGEQNPVHTFPNAGDFTVSLTVTDANGTDTAQMTVSVAQPEPSAVEQTPPLPNIGDGDIRSTLNNIFQNGQGIGRHPWVFSVAGDQSMTASAFLDPFATGNYALDDGTNYLQPIIDWYNATDLGGFTSFNAPSRATGGSWDVEDLLDPENRDQSVCNNGETPLDCEIRIAQPGAILIGIGYNDIPDMGDENARNQFRDRLREVVQRAANSGVMPVLFTTQPRPDNAANAFALNEIILEVADDENVPVYNQWAALNALPNGGLNGDNTTISAPGLPGDITGGATGQFGEAVRNRDVLTILSDIRSNIFPGASLPAPEPPPVEEQLPVEGEPPADGGTGG